MPSLNGTVTSLIKKKDGTVFGLKTNEGEFLFSWPDKREEPFEDDKVQVGSVVEGTWMPFEKDGKNFKYLSVLSVTGGDVTPQGESPQMDGSYRSPKDFRRTSALAQAVAFLATEPEADAEEVVRIAQRFETYLGGGV